MGRDAEAAAALFDPARLTLAREASGLTQTELAKRVGLTPGAVSQYERGYSRPSPPVLRHMSMALGFPAAFLAGGEPLQVVQPSDAFFRKLASTTRREQSEARAVATLLRLFVQTLERYVDLPALDLPAFPVEEGDPIEVIDQAAQGVRDAWGLGERSVSDVVHELEAHGIPVARVAEVAARVDAFSALTMERPVVLLGEHKGDRARSRFDASHELGHLVMHREFRGSHSERERQAHRFASAFLAPPAAVVGQLPSRVDVNALLALKRAWGMSMQAFLIAARDHAVMNDATYRRAMTQFGANGWRRAEPGYLGEPEVPAMLRRSVAVLDGIGVPLPTLAADQGLPLDRLARMIYNDRPKVDLDN